MYLQKFTLLLFIFSSGYLLTFWIKPRDTHQKDYQKYHLTLINIIAGLAVIIFLFLPFSLHIKVIVAMWKILTLGISKISWRNENPNPLLLSIPSVVGFPVIIFINVNIMKINPSYLSLIFICAMIISALVFTVSRRLLNV